MLALPYSYRGYSTQTTSARGDICVIFLSFFHVEVQWHWPLTFWSENWHTAYYCHAKRSDRFGFTVVPFWVRSPYKSTKQTSGVQGHPWRRKMRHRNPWGTKRRKLRGTNLPFSSREISALNRLNSKQFIDELRVIVTALIRSGAP